MAFKMSEEIILKSRSPSYEIPNVSVGQYLMSKLEKLEDNICLIHNKTGTQLTVKQLVSKANSVAVALIKRGITKSDIILCFSQNNLEYAILQFAIYLLGNTFTPVTPVNGVFELKNHIRDSGSTFIFTSVSNSRIVHKVLKDENNDDINKQIKLVVVFDGNYDNFLPFNQLLGEGNNEKLEKIPYFDIKPKEDLFAIVYTSGTTGLPKGTMNTHFTIIANLESFHLFSGLRSKENVIIADVYPFGHISGTFFSLAWISLGQTIVIYEEIDEELIVQSIEKYKINFLPLFPSFGRRLLDGDLKDKYDISSLKFIVTGGSKFPIDVAKGLKEKYNVIFGEIYGMTEFITAVDISKSKIGSVGLISENVELKIVDLNTGKSLGPNMDGEIYLRGPKIFSGYLNNESATKAAIDSDGWLHTGDIGHYDEEERLFITDRLKELIKFKAWSVFPAEIESLLLTHKSVEAVVVVGVKHATDGQYPRAYVKKNSEVTEEELTKFVEENMGFQKRLRGGVIFVDEIPRTMIGKVDRKYFKSLVENETIVV